MQANVLHLDARRYTSITTVYNTHLTINLAINCVYGLFPFTLTR